MNELTIAALAIGWITTTLWFRWRRNVWHKRAMQFERVGKEALAAMQAAVVIMKAAESTLTTLTRRQTPSVNEWPDEIEETK